MVSSNLAVASDVMYSLAGLHAVAVRLLPGAEVPIHEHEHKDEVFDVVRGAGRLMVDGKQVPGERGTLVVVPRGTPHGLRNTGSEDWVIRETARERLYTRGSLAHFLIPLRLWRQSRSIMRDPCRQFSCCANTPLPVPLDAARPTFSLAGFMGSVIIVRALQGLSLGCERHTDLICDPVQGNGRLRWGAYEACLSAGTVAFLPAGYRALIENDGDLDLVLRITRRQRPSRPEMARMVWNAIGRRM